MGLAVSVGQGRYLLFKKIARGGMAEIYLGKQIGEDGFQRVCCIKRILPHYAQDTDFIEMFRDEAHICKRLTHANIVRVEGFEEVEGSYAIIMEYVDGGDLRSLLAACEKNNERLNIPSAVFIAAEAARGLHYSHEKKDEVTGRPLEIVHRDVSPQNILISFEGEVKITDFGIADAQARNTETKPGIVKGKYSYMSPEQISARPVDARTDVFALAIVLWEMLGMKRLFQGDNEVMTIQLVRSCKITKDLRQLNNEVNSDLFEIIHKSLSRDPRDRHRNAAEFEKDLRRYLNRSYPDFSGADLAQFMKRTLATKRAQTEIEISQLLSHEQPTVRNTDANLRMTAVMGGQRDQQLSASVNVNDGLSGRMSSSQLSHASKNIGLIGNKTQQGRRLNTLAPQTQGVGGRRENSTIDRARGRPNPRYDYQFSAIKPKRSSLFPSRVIAVFVMIFSIGYGIERQLNSKKTNSNQKYSVPYDISFSTFPERVRITHNGRPLRRGQYVTTPVTVAVSSYGQQTLELSREGLANDRFEFDAISPPKVTYRALQRIAPKAQVRIILPADEDGPARVVVDDGIEDISLESGKDIELSDITFGVKHRLTISPVSQSKERFFCDFTPRAITGQGFHLIVLDMEKKSCKQPSRF